LLLAKPLLSKPRLVITWALLALGANPAAAGPEGGTVVGGSASIQGAGTPAVIVNQASSSAVINWNTFNIRANESVRFNQPSSSSVVLNRVTGGLGPSEIMGTLTANGRVFLINRDGILFGPGSVVNTAGFLATTNDIRNADFMAGRYNFNIPGRPDASIVNQGRITATSGGFAALVAPGVRNSGTITATLGTVALASGNSFTLDMYGDKLITLAVGDQIASKVIDVATGKPLRSLVSNTKSGTISANGGRVELTAAAARAVVDSVINTRGVIRADSIGHRNGLIVLNAATGGSKPAGAPAQTIKLAGTISAAGRHRGTTGGTVVVSGEHIKLANAKIDASGRRGGGKVLIGGDWGGGHPNTTLISNASAKLENYTIATATTVSVDARSTINASATGRGNGGKVVLWSDSETTFAGTILARGGAQIGNGGFVEVSSHRLLNYNGMTDTRAVKGSVGTLLLDPENYYVNANGLPPKSDPTASAISADVLVKQLASSDVVLSTLPSGTNAGDIFVNANLSWTTDKSLTLSAYHDILFMSGSKMTNSGAGNLVLRADNTGRGQGTVVFDSGGHVDYTGSTGTVSIFYNPSGPTKYRNPTDYFCPPCAGGGGIFVNPTQPSQLTAYMLVNTAGDLNDVRTNTSGTYALGRDINAGSIANFAPIPNFTGLFDGQGQIIVNLTIASTAQNVGLFGSIGSTGVVRNLNLIDVTASGLNSQFVGALAGTNAGTISNVSASNVAVSVGSNGNGGGLVGLNSGNITNAFATGDVTGVAGTNGFTTLGGLAAVNLGSISSSFATVAVGSPNVANLQAGGFVGNNSGTILSSVATGNVQTGDASISGGLVASNSVSGAITGSRASGNVAVGAASVAGGLVGTSAGTITDSTAAGAVSSGGANSTIGGLVGASTGTITDSTAAGMVSSAGANSTVGGFVGANAGTIADSTASGAVTSSGANSTVGGFAGVSTGAITNSTASGGVTSTGANSTVGDFIGTSPNGNTTGRTPGGTTDVTAPNSPTLPSTVTSLSIATLPVAKSQLPFSREFLAALSAQQTAQQAQAIQNLGSTLQLAALNTAPVVNNLQDGIRLPPQQQPSTQPAGHQQLSSGFGRQVIDVPAPTETRFVKDEVVLQIAANITVERLQAAVGHLGLTLVASENLAITGSTVVRFRITNGKSPSEIIRALAAIQLVAVAQPNYIYALQQQASNPAPATRGNTMQGDDAQYVLEKLNMSDVHRIVRGANVPIAVIDSEIDVTHPDLEGTVARRFSAVGAPEKPHAHGTGMAGAMAAHQKLLGTAPDARLLAVNAFSSNAATVESTTFIMLKGIDWAVGQGARIINMSFAGPKDPSLQRALKFAFDKGIVLIAAAGNAGPKSPPLFPGADPNVIAVTATDVKDKLFNGANRGKYISVAAPGVDILVPAPENTYQLTTGTSVAAAEVSGIVALLLERNPKLTPAEIRRILTASARRLGPGERDDNFGSGLIDPPKALQLADPRIATTASGPTTLRQR
ncbi:MAG: S8 family serine peptidase, partial [Xanthobacteraceae bacterium]